jgi:hypothetical protein
MLASTEVLMARHAKDWLVSGVLSPYVDTFAQSLLERGYRRDVVRFYLDGVAHFVGSRIRYGSRQRQLKGIAASGLADEDAATAFQRYTSDRELASTDVG